MDLFDEGEAAFLKDLPSLLAEYPGNWVAYCGARQIGVARTKAEAYQACYAHGLKEDEFLVRCVEPRAEEDVIGFGDASFVARPATQPR
jgi:hypothetical protein